MDTHALTGHENIFQMSSLPSWKRHWFSHAFIAGTNRFLQSYNHTRSYCIFIVL